MEIAKKAFPKQDDIEEQKRRKAFWTYASNVLDVVGAGGKALGFVEFPFAKKVGDVTDLLGKAAKNVAEELDELAKAKTLREARDEIKGDLAKLKRPIVMIVDDVDRLEADEIRTLFRVVKACADFPNVRYLLLFDRPQVSRALEGSEKGGEEFFEKIVNVMFDLPIVSDEKRMKMLRGALRPITEHATETEATRRVDEVFDGVLKPGLPTLRMVKRFAATAGALALGMEDAAGANYDPADFLLLEFLRSRALGVYEAVLSYRYDMVEAVLRKNRSEGTPASPWSQNLMTKIQETGDAQGEVKEAVKLLRPDLDIETGDVNTSSFAGLSSAKRFYDPIWQGIYLGYDANRAPLREERWKEFADLLESDKSDVQLPEELTKGTRQGEVVQAICLRLASLSNDAVRRLIIAAFIWGEGLVINEPTLGRFNSRLSDLAIFLAERGLQTLWERGQDVLDLLDEVAEQTSAPLVRLALLEHVAFRLSRRGRDYWGPRDVAKQRFKEEVGRVQAMIDDKSIYEQKGAQRLMEAWRSSMSEDTVKAYYERKHKDPVLLGSYLEYACPMPTDDSSSGDLDGPSEFEKAVLNLDSSQLTERGRLIQAKYRENTKRAAATRLRVERMMDKC